MNEALLIKEVGEACGPYHSKSQCNLIYFLSVKAIYIVAAISQSISIKSLLVSAYELYYKLRRGALGGFELSQ